MSIKKMFQLLQIKCTGKKVHGSINYEFKMGHIVGNNIAREMKTGMNNLILQASLSLGKLALLGKVPAGFSS